MAMLLPAPLDHIRVDPLISLMRICCTQCLKDNAFPRAEIYTQLPDKPTLPTDILAVNQFAQAHSQCATRATY